MGKTEDLIRKLSEDRRLPPSPWPAYPLLPMALTLVLELVLPHLAMEGVCHAFTVPSVVNFPIWAPGAIVALSGATLALRLASPTEGGFGEVVIVALGTLVTIRILLWTQEPSAQAGFFRAFFLSAAVALPGLAVSILLLRRGATLHPFTSGMGAGFSMGGIGMAALMLLCDGLAMPDRLAAAWVATWALGLFGGLLGFRFLHW